MLNAQDVKNTLIFLKRVNLNGEESMAHAELMIKYTNLLAEKENDEKLDGQQEGQTGED